MPGMSIHVVDVSRGIVAAGMAVEVSFVAGAIERRVVAFGNISQNGTLDHPGLNEVLEPGRYEAVFHVSAYYRDCGVVLPANPFLGVVTYEFGIADPRQHYHLPFKCTPWGYSCFRGGV